MLIVEKNLVATVVHPMPNPYFYKMWNPNTMELVYKQPISNAVR
jgi:hypothetical protein